MEKHKTELSLNKNFTFSTKFGISSPTFVGFFVCGMMGRFEKGVYYKKSITNLIITDYWVC